MPSLTPDRIRTADRPAPKRRGKKETASAAPDRKSQARSFMLRRRLQTIRRISTLVLLAGFVLGGIWAWKSGEADRLIVAIEDVLPQISDMPGLTVKRIDVSGGSYLSAETVSAATGIADGTKIADIDLGAVRLAVEDLGWVKQARVARLLPDMIRIDIVERTPYALWQHDGVLRLVDDLGVEITQDRLNRFAALPLVVGAGAPLHAYDLMNILETQPNLAARVEAAVRVGERRWDLRFTNGVTVRLPELGAPETWERLAELERNQGILGRDIAALDMRLPDRLIVRLTPAAAQARGKENDDRT